MQRRRGRPTPGETSTVSRMVDGLTLELRAGESPGLVLVQGKDRIRVELANVKAVVAALAGGAADLAEVLAAGGLYHA